MKLRKHQQEAIDLADMIHRRDKKLAGRKTFSACVTPGGGKTLAARLFAARLAERGIINRVVYITTNDTLKYQAIEAFNTTRGEVGEPIALRAWSNDEFPNQTAFKFYGTKHRAVGIAVNIQAIAAAHKRENFKLVESMHGGRYVLICDEVHHLSSAEDASWGRETTLLRQACTYELQVTGTPFRSDDERIIDAPVSECGTMYQHDITYTRRDALADGAILQAAFHTFDGRAVLPYERRNVLLSEATVKERATAIQIALNDPEYVAAVAVGAINMWKQYRDSDPKAKMLFVCASKEAAARLLPVVRSQGITAVIADSDQQDAPSILADFRTNHIDALITVAMASEGFDCPALSHLVYLTNVTTPLAIMQAFGRVLRPNHSSPLPTRQQVGHIICLADPRIIPQIETWLDEQRAFLMEKQTREIVNRESNGGRGARLFGTCEPADINHADESGSFLSPSQRDLYNSLVREFPFLGNLTVSEALSSARKIADLMGAR